MMVTPAASPSSSSRRPVPVNDANAFAAAVAGTPHASSAARSPAAFRALRTPKTLRGIEGEERAVVLVRLDDEHVAGARVRVRTDVSQHGTADERRIEAAGPKRGPDKRRGRALAVGPGDRDHALTGGELAPSVLALPDGETRRARGGHLDVRVAVRARADDDVRTGDVPRVER